MIGASRKRFLADVLPEGAQTEDRDLPTAVLSALAAKAGAWAVRVHDVPSTKRALDVWTAWENGAT
jgi:dihydropteroate synthase